MVGGGGLSSLALFLLLADGVSLSKVKSPAALYCFGVLEGHWSVKLNVQYTGQAQEVLYTYIVIYMYLYGYTEMHYTIKH